MSWLCCRKSPEGHRFKPRLGHLDTGKLNRSDSKWVPVSNQGRIRPGKEDVLCFS